MRAWVYTWSEQARRFWFSFIYFVGFNFLRLKSYGLRTGLLGDHFVLLFGRDWEIALWSQAIAQISVPCQNQCLPTPGDKCEQVCVHAQACRVVWIFLGLLNSTVDGAPTLPTSSVSSQCGSLESWEWRREPLDRPFDWHFPKGWVRKGLWGGIVGRDCIFSIACVFPRL